MHYLKYILGFILGLPLLPIMYWQAGRIWKSMPKLPEAELDREGVVGDAKLELKLLTIGESTIAGVGVDTHKKGLTGYLAKYLSDHKPCMVKWKVMAQNGFTAKKVVDRILPHLESENPDLIVIGLGANNAFQRSSPKGWAKEILSLVNKLRILYPYPPIVFMNMPPVKEFPVFTKLLKFFIGNLAEILGEELKRIVVDMPNVWYYEDIITIREWINPNGEVIDHKDYFSDGVHPTEATYKIWGQRVGAYIMKNVPVEKQN